MVTEPCPTCGAEMEYHENTLTGLREWFCWDCDFSDDDDDPDYDQDDGDY